MVDVQGKYFQFIVALTANLVNIADGIAVGWTSPMIPYFLSDKSHIKMTSHEAEWIETYYLLGCIAGMPISAYFTDKIGRKKSLLFGTFIVMLCWISIIFANKIEYINGARFVKGMGSNMACISVAMFVAEISHKNIRGFLSSQIFMARVLGNIIVYSVGPFVPYYVSSAIAACLLLVEIIVFAFVPESPYFLLYKHECDKAKKSLKTFRGGSDIDVEFEEMKQAVELEKTEVRGRIQDIILVKQYRTSLFIVTVLNTIERLSCIMVILMNIKEILESVGSVYIDSSVAAILFSVIMFLSCIVASINVDKFGRKVLFIISCVLTGLCLLTLAIYFNLNSLGYDLETISWIPIAVMMSYGAVFKIGLGTIPMVISAEIFSPQIKAIGMTFADFVLILTSIVSLQIYHSFKNIFGMYFPFYIFSSFPFIGAIYVTFFVPETKGQSLSDIQQKLKK